MVLRDSSLFAQKVVGESDQMCFIKESPEEEGVNMGQRAENAAWLIKRVINGALPYASCHYQFGRQNELGGGRWHSGTSQLSQTEAR